MRIIKFLYNKLSLNNKNSEPKMGKFKISLRKGKRNKNRQSSNQI